MWRWRGHANRLDLAADGGVFGGSRAEHSQRQAMFCDLDRYERRVGHKNIERQIGPVRELVYAKKGAGK